MPSADSSVVPGAALTQATRWPALVPSGAALFAVAAGLSILLGWSLGSELLIRGAAGFPAAAPLSGVGFVVAGLGLALSLRAASSAPAHAAARLSAGLLVLLGLGVLGESLLGWPLGSDRWVFPEVVRRHGSGAGEMAPNTALSWLLFGGALFGATARRPALRRIGRWAAAAVLALSLLALVGYIYGVPYLFELPGYAGMALLSALTLGVLAEGILFSHPEPGDVAFELGRAGSAGTAARLLLPAAVIFPVGLGWVALQGQNAGLYGTVTGIALLVSAMVGSLVAHIAYSTGRLREADRTREAARQRLAGIVGSAMDAIISVDEEHRIVVFNAAAEDVFGVSAEEAIGHPVDRFIPERLRAGHRQHVVRFAEAGVSGRSRHAPAAVNALRADGREFPIEATISRVVVEGRALSTVILRDVTERRAAEAALRERETRLRLALDSGKMGTWETDEVARVATLDPAESALLGLGPEGRTISIDAFWNQVHPEDRERVVRQVAEAGDAQGEFDAEFRVVRPGGAVRWLATHGQILRQEGRAVRMIGVNYDITERKQAEDQIQRAGRLQAVGKLAGGMAHEVNNMLTAVVGFAEFVLQGLPHGHPQRPDVNEILKAAGRGAAITQQVLAFSRQQVLQPATLDLNSLLRELRPLLSRLVGADTRVDFRFAEPLAPVRVDKGQFEQVLVNLAANARDAMPEGGRLSVETSELELDDECVRARHALELAPGRYVVVTVSDTGTGMNDQVRARAFEPFFTTKAPGRGTGLGLASVYGTVKQSGGDVWLDSAPGGGTSVKIVLPASSGEVRGPRGPGESGRPAGGRETVLVVDDEPVVRTMARRSLEVEGYRVLEAEDGAAAVQLARDGATQFDLVLCDVVMPGLNGKEVRAELEALRPGVPVVFMSGYTGEEVRHRGLLPAGSAFVPKPFGPTTLARRVRDALDRATASALHR